MVSGAGFAQLVSRTLARSYICTNDPNPVAEKTTTTPKNSHDIYNFTVFIYKSYSIGGFLLFTILTVYVGVLLKHFLMKKHALSFSYYVDKLKPTKVRVNNCCHIKVLWAG